MTIKEMIYFLAQFPNDMEISFGYYRGENPLAREDFALIEENGVQSLVIYDYEWSSNGRSVDNDPRMAELKRRSEYKK